MNSFANVDSYLEHTVAKDRYRARAQVLHIDRPWFCLRILLWRQFREKDIRRRIVELNNIAAVFDLNIALMGLQMNYRLVLQSVALDGEQRQYD